MEGLQDTDAGGIQALQSLSSFLFRSIEALSKPGHSSDLDMDAVAHLLTRHDKAAQDFLRNVMLHVRQNILVVGRNIFDSIPLDVMASFPMVMFVLL